MAKKAGTTKAAKAGGRVVAARASLALHAAATKAAKAEGVTLGEAIVRGLQMFVDAPRTKGAEARKAG